MDEFLEDLTSGEIHFRDRWQFELKSEFHPRSSTHSSTYGQEFYFFIPNALQVNSNNYSREEFYRDLTNFIRYKTPEFSLSELIAQENELSPFNILKKLLEKEECKETREQAKNELKILGNVLRSSVRERIAALLVIGRDDAALNNECMRFCQELQKVRDSVDELQRQIMAHFTNEKLRVTCSYFDEFISNTLDYYLTGLLEELRRKKNLLNSESDEAICKAIIREQKHREAIHHLVLRRHEQTDRRDEILYRSGLLKKFIIDALVLPVARSSVQEQFGHFIGSFSAGIAMLIYILLFVWQGQWFVINSAPFIIITVAAYILKDRLKETLKTMSFRRALRWFSDYNTEILSPDEKITLGNLKESFTFIDESIIPKEILHTRQREFHNVLEMFKRPEQVIYFKRLITMYAQPRARKKRFSALNILLRFNVQDFLTKASNPYHSYSTLDPETKSILRIRLPKVYHLNIILKNTFANEKNEPVTELKKFRLILDKNGIKHIEYLS